MDRKIITKKNLESYLKKSLYTWSISVAVLTTLLMIVPGIITDTPIDSQTTICLVVLTNIMVLGITMAHSMFMFIAIGEYLCQEDQADDNVPMPAEPVSC